MTVETAVLATTNAEVALTDAFPAIEAPEARGVDFLIVNRQRLAAGQRLAAQRAAWLAATAQETLSILGLHEVALKLVFA